MAQKNNISKIIIHSVLIIALSYFSQYSYTMYIVALFAMPAIISLFICNYGISKAIYANISAFVFCVIIAMTRNDTSIPITALLLLFALIPGIIIGICFTKKYSFTDLMIINTAFDCIVLLFMLILAKFLYNASISSEIQSIFSETFSDQILIIKSVYPAYAEQIDAMEHEIFNAIYIALPGMIPFAAALASITLYIVRYAICKSVIKRCLVENNIFSDGFDTFRPGIVTNIALAVAIFGIVVATSMKWFMIFANIILIILALYFVTFVSIVEFRLKEHMHNTAKRVFTIITIFVISILISIFMPIINFVYIFILIGILDSFFDFRKLSEKKGEINEK